MEGGVKLMKASTFEGSTRIPYFETMNPSNFHNCTQKKTFVWIQTNFVMPTYHEDSS